MNTQANEPRLYDPPDVLEAHDAWGANCGPAALAALLAAPVMSVQRYFPEFPRRTWVNPTAMKAALTAAGARWTLTRRDPGYPAGHPGVLLPACGLAFVQIDGPWCNPGVPVGAAYRRTHWIAWASTEFDSSVYDVNAFGWLRRHEWENEILPLLLAHHKGAAGWWVRTGLEVGTDG